MFSLLSLPRCLSRLTLLTIAIGVMFLAGGARPAFAHNTYVDSSPRDGEVLTTAPVTWSVEFAKDVPLASASGEIVLADGSRATLAAPRHGETNRIIVFDFPSNLSKSVTARWRLVSTDGHVISGRVSFSIQSADPVQQQITPTTTTAQTTAPTLNLLTQSTIPSTLSPVVLTDDDEVRTPESIRVVLRFGNYLAVIVLGGLLFADWYIAAGSLTTVLGRRLLLISSATLAVVPFFNFLILASDLRGGLSSFGDGLSSAWSLTAGSMLVFRTMVGGLVTMLVAQLAGSGRRDGAEAGDRYFFSLAAILTMYLIALAYGGHSRSQRAPWLGIPVDALHVAASAVWIGGLIATVFVIIPAVGNEQAITAFNRFGYVAERAVAVIVATGIVQSLRLHGGLSSIFSSTHGLLLIVKAAVVAVMLRYAMRNRRLLAESRQRLLSRPDSIRATLLRASLAETGLGAAVIAITAVLVAVSPS